MKKRGRTVAAAELLRAAITVASITVAIPLSGCGVGGQSGEGSRTPASVPRLSSTEVSNTVQKDLSSAFKSYDVVRVEGGLARIEQSQAFSVKIDGQEKQVRIEPNDVRAPGFRAYVTGAKGLSQLGAAPVRTYKGQVSGESGSIVRVSLDENGISGYVESGGRKTFFDPAKNLSKAAASGDVVLYHEDDVRARIKELDDDSMSLPTSVNLSKALSMHATLSGAVASLRVLELATEADYEFVNSKGGAEAANAFILGVINQIEGIYNRDLGLTISVTYQHAWTTQDPFDGSSITNLLVSYGSYWDTNFLNIHRDTTFLWTGKSSAAYKGLAWIGSVCFSPSSYALAGPLGGYSSLYYLMGAHELGHNLGADHDDSQPGCSATIMNAVLSGGTQPKFCDYTIGVIATYIAQYGSCLAQGGPGPSPSPSISPSPSPSPSPHPSPTPMPPSDAQKFDFDGDRKADVAVFRPSSGTWYVQGSATGLNAVQFGRPGDIAVAADYDGDLKTDYAVFRPSDGTWYIQGSYRGFFAMQWGVAGDIPVPADYDGDGKTDLAVFRPSEGNWYIFKSSLNTYEVVHWGAAGDIPMPGDYDGDGKADINVWRPSDGIWYRINSSDGVRSFQQWGALGDKPVKGDFNGDGKTDIAVYRPSEGNWYILNSSNSYNPPVTIVHWGAAEDIPAVADFDFDGKSDMAVFRPSDGNWYWLKSASPGSYGVIHFGLNGDVPAQMRPAP